MNELFTYGVDTIEKETKQYGINVFVTTLLQTIYN
jgi:hypothetical protein